MKVRRDIIGKRSGKGAVRSRAIDQFQNQRGNTCPEAFAGEAHPLAATFGQSQRGSGDSSDFGCSYGRFARSLSATAATIFSMAASVNSLCGKAKTATVLSLL
jgi:hypothetical protein